MMLDTIAQAFRAGFWAGNGGELPQLPRMHERCQRAPTHSPATELCISIKDNCLVVSRPPVHTPLQHELLVPRTHAGCKVFGAQRQVHLFLWNVLTLCSIPLVRPHNNPPGQPSTFQFLSGLIRYVAQATRPVRCCVVHRGFACEGSKMAHEPLRVLPQPGSCHAPSSCAEEVLHLRARRPQPIMVLFASLRLAPIVVPEEAPREFAF